MAVKGISRKELKEDRFIGLFSRILIAVSRRIGLFLGALGIVLLFGGVGLGVYLYYAKEEERALDMLAEADLFYRRALSGISPELQGIPSGKGPLEVYQALIVRYPRSRAAEEALFRQAVLYLRTARYGEAIKGFQGYLERYGRGRFRPLVELGLAHAYEAQGDFPRAAETYSRLVTNHPQDPWLGEAYMGLGRSFEALGKTKEALETYRKAASELANSNYGERVRRKVELLQGS